MANKLFRRLVAGLALLAIAIGAMPAKAQEDIVAIPDTYDFGTVYIGQSATMTGNITNINAGTAMVTSWEWTYNPLNAFAVTSEITPGTLFTTGESLDYQVTFTAPEFSFWTATLRYHLDAPWTRYVDITFYGFGDYDPGQPNIAVWPLALDFGAISIGDNGTQTVTVTNTAGGELVFNVSIAGSVDFGFPPGAPTSFTVSGGASQDVVLLYSPSNTGDDDADLVITHNDPYFTDDVLVPMTGTGLPAAATCDISVSPSDLEFGEVLVGNTITLAVTLENTGPGDCIIYDLRFTGSSEFVVNPDAPLVPFVLPAGDPPVQLPVEIDYTPIDGGADTGELAVLSDDPDSPEQLVNLTGTGVFSLVDLDLGKLHASNRVPLSRDRAVRLWTRIRNNGLDEGDRLIRLTGVQGGVTVYVHSRLVGDPVGRGGTRIDFPSYVPDAAGLIIWTVVLFDDDPDVDTVTASTTVVP